MDELTREFLIESQEGLDRMERCLTELEEKPGDPAILGEIFRSVHTIKGTTGFLGYKRLESLAHAGENLLGLLRDGKASADAERVTVLLHLLDRLRSILKNIEETGEDGNASKDGDLIARLEELQNLTVVAKAASTRRRASRARSRKTPAKAGPSVPLPASQPAAEPEPGPDVPKTGTQSADTQPSTSAAAESTLRVDISLLNRMMNLVGELVLTRNQVLQATADNPNWTMLSRRLDKVTADLRESVMRARMQPVSNIFSKVPRILRDVCQLLGKRVRLEMDGQDTELDKSLLEAIKDPITHAVRNALDHGIESQDARLSAGKEAEGTLKLRAYQEGSHVVVEVSDDGAGMSVERIRQKAIERGLITAERAALQSERELLQLIFLPGFSTAASVTSVSGRGVGMDVVRTNVEKIGGKVEIESRSGKGTTLRMRIPLTLAIIPALIVRSLGQSFALPQGALSELVHVGTGESSRIEWMEDAPVFRLRNTLLPLVLLEQLLMPGHDVAPASNADRFIAVLDADGRRYGLVVEGLADPEEIVVKPLSPVLKEIGIYSGATVLGNGDLALILDPGFVAARAGIALSEEEHTASIELQTEAAKREEFLVVDVSGRQAAVPLATVLRIERISVTRIEYAGVRPVLRFEGELLPIDDPAGLLRGGKQSEVAVVVCRHGGKQVGLAVTHVLDVAAGSNLFEAGTTIRAEGVMLVRECVTNLLDPIATAQALNEPAIEDYSGAEEMEHV